MRGLVSIVLCAALLALSACSGHAPGATTVTSTQSNNYEPSTTPLDTSKADVTAMPTGNEAPSQPPIKALCLQLSLLTPPIRQELRIC